MASNHSTTSVIQRIPFHDDQLLAIVDERTGKEYVLPKPMADMFGLLWHGQLAKLRRSKLFSQGLQKVCIPTEGGIQEAVLLERHLVHAWLLSIDVSRVTEDYQEKLLAYQKECAKVLDAYFTKKQVQPPPAVPQVPDPEERAKRTFNLYEYVGARLGTPNHIVHQEAIKYIHTTIGIDLRPLLAESASQEHIPEQDVSLEPTELAQRLGYPNAMRMNMALAELGWQVKRVGTWEPTEAGKPYCSRHAWISRGKSGYNLKWKLLAVREALATPSETGDPANG